MNETDLLVHSTEKPLWVYVSKLDYAGYTFKCPITVEELKKQLSIKIFLEVWREKIRL